MYTYVPPHSQCMARAILKILTYLLKNRKNVVCLVSVPKWKLIHVKTHHFILWKNTFLFHHDIITYYGKKS